MPGGVAALFGQDVCGAAAPEPSPQIPEVLILNSYHPGYGWSDSEQVGVIEVLTRNFPAIQFSVEYLDFRRFPQAERIPVMVQGLKQKYDGKPVHLIITLDDFAVRFALNHRQEILGAAPPLVFGGVNYLTPDVLAGQTNVTGVAESKDLAGTLDLIQRLQPSARELTVIYDQNRSALESRAALEAELARKPSCLTIRWLTDWTEASLMKSLDQLDPHSAALFLSATVDQDGKIISDDTNFVLSVKAHSRAPVYMISQPLARLNDSTDWDTAAWAGLGGCMLSGETHGRIVGEMAVRVLRGEKADSIAVRTTTPARLAVDYLEMQRFGLSVSALPAGAEVFHRPKSYFETHRSEIGVVLVIVGTFSTAIVLLVINILRRQRAEAALRLSNERFKLVAKTTNDAVWDWKPHTSEMWWNESYYTVLGVPHDTTPSFDSWADSIHPDDRQRVVDDLHVALAGDTLTWHSRYRFVRPDGTTGSVFNRTIFLRDEAGKAVRAVGAMLDTTRANSLEEQVRFSQKMEAIGQLAGGVAHDFNNLLQVILGYTLFAMESEPQGSEQRENLGEIQKAAERAAQLTRQLLVFGRRQPLLSQDVELGPLVSEHLKLMRRLIDENITVEFSADGQLETIHANPGLIEQVLMNLCVNARDAMPHGGKLAIELRNAALSKADCEHKPWAKPGRYVLMRVTDTGCGMDKATLARVFDPFFSTKPKEKGTGLGLSVVYGIIQQHHGLVHVESSPGAGTTFHIYLPAKSTVDQDQARQLSPLTGPSYALPNHPF